MPKHYQSTALKSKLLLYVWKAFTKCARGRVAFGTEKVGFLCLYKKTAKKCFIQNMDWANVGMQSTNT